MAAPFATRQLADLGARVIKVERRGEGDFARHYDVKVKGLASYFVWLNRSKESLTLDLKHPEAKEILLALLAQADVFVQNLAPGAAERLGFGAKALRESRPSLIVCDVSGYGSSGPFRDKTAYDLLVQGETGMVSVTGDPNSPAKVGISVADIAAGMYSFSAVLTALYHRLVTGQGASTDVSLFDSLSEWMSQPVYYTLYSGTPPERTGTSHASIAPYGSFTAAEGSTVQMGIQNDREWRRFCDQVLGRAEVAEDPRFSTNALRVANRDELTAIIEASFAGMSAAEVVASLDGAKIANSRLNGVVDLIEHPQLATRDRWTEVGSPVGPLRALLPPIQIEGMVPRMDPIPDLGQHTSAILAELGYTDAEVDRLRSDEVI